MNVVLREMLRDLESRSPGPMVVGVGGGSCSGKSTVAAWLVRHLADSKVLRMDDYYRSRPAGEGISEVNFDTPESLDLEMLRLHLERLRKGERIEKPNYDFRTHSRTGFEFFDPAGRVILDGLFALHQSIRRKVDFGVFDACSDRERRLRRILRDSAERGRSRMSIVHQYDTMVRPMHDLHVEDTRRAADVILSNDEPWDGEEMT